MAWGGGWRSLWLASGLVSLVGLGIVAGLIPDRVEPATGKASAASRGNRRLAALVAAPLVLLEEGGLLRSSTLPVRIGVPLAYMIAMLVIVMFGLELPQLVATRAAGWRWTGDIHVLLANYGMLTLVGLHVAAALYHYFIRRDRVLQRMLPGQ